MIKVLQVVGSLGRGGAETWLIHVLRHIDRSRFQIDFIVNAAEPEADGYDDEAKALGAKILPCMGLTRPLEYRRNFMRILREHGPYHVVHSHVHHFSGYALWLAYQAGVPVRISHSHIGLVEPNAPLLRRMYLNGMQVLLERYATRGLAASLPAADSLFGKNWRSNPKWQIFYCGIDLKPFTQRPDTLDVLRTLPGIPPGAFLVGNVGRFYEQKNHRFLIDIAAETVKRDPNVYFVLVGEGPLRPEIEARATGAGIRDHVIFTGTRNDIPSIMQVLDVFLMPSLYEGLALVTIEAQAAGLPMVLSDTITAETTIVPGLSTFLSLSQSVSVWSEAILQFKQTGAPVPHEKALETVLKSPFNIEISVSDLEQLYCGR